MIKWIEIGSSSCLEIVQLVWPLRYDVIPNLTVDRASDCSKPNEISSGQRERPLPKMNMHRELFTPTGGEQQS